MAIPTSGNISIKEAAGSDRSIDTAVSSIISGSLHTLGDGNAISYTGGTAPPGASAQTSTAPTGMREFYGYAHTFATSYFTTLRGWFESDGLGRVTSGATVRLKVIYESGHINIYALTTGGDDEAGGPANSPGTSYELAYRVSNPPTGYTARYSYSHTSGDGPFPWDTYQFGGNMTQEGFIGGAYGGLSAITTVASSIGSGVIMSLSAESAADNDYVSVSNEIGTITLHLEKSGETTYTWAGALTLLARSSSIGS